MTDQLPNTKILPHWPTGSFFHSVKLLRLWGMTLLGQAHAGMLKIISMWTYEMFIY